MDLLKLRYFIAAAETGSFTGAARREFTSQPNVSKQIASLEQELNARLFHREKRAVTLTRAGEYFYEQVRRLPSEMDRIAKTTQALARSDRGDLSIGLLSGQRLSGELMEGFNRFTREHPDVHFVLERAGFAALRSALEDGQYDIILTLSFDIPDNNDWEITPILKQSVAVFVSRMSPIADVSELADAPFVAISPKESFGGFEQLLRFCRSRGFEPNIVRLADSLDSLLFYVEAGVGVAVLDRNTRLETDRSIHTVPLVDQEASDIIAVRRRGNPNPHIDKMLACLRRT